MRHIKYGFEDLKEDELREEGIKAVIALQAMAGITETREQAEAGWDSFSDREKKQTMIASSLFVKKGGN